MAAKSLGDRLRRRAGRWPVIIGLTGSIGMGKSTLARMARRLGVAVHDADATVHALLGRRGAAVAAVLAAFPGVGTLADGIDRKALGARVFGRPPALARLEAILHPLVRRREAAFLRRCGLGRRKVVILDVPLLFETGGEHRCDRVMVVSAPAFLQSQRVLRRPGMTAALLADIRARQTSEAVKRLNAEAVVPTGLGPRPALRALRANLTMARSGVRRWRRGKRTYRPHA
ncbi:dephospho-CoA kinase [Rhodospirillum rubrum]|uniref:dephospho-CoA kinase n=1 Tax=Rhodospirillum rubrum TaxID=1085 RepID=UPI0019031293|nr:dephospho-CoA kinase [Rhodospirillum rubrum]MBK1663218.1 dephospho-CoA kinase [Rhodospirillum rubrum]MBK1676953.1 dephospho-CoA kinase [Rhodospirillum rubrum]